MIGRVDNSGRALLAIEVRAESTSALSSIEAWVDTGFTGDLVLPQNVIDRLQLPKSGSVDAILADGSTIELSTYSCVIAWFDKERRLEVVANEGDHPLLGIGLLLAKELRIDYRNLRLSLLPVEKQS
jgi:clan AA aspartic protease